MTDTTRAYLQPLQEAAAWLKLRLYPADLDRLGAVLDKLGPYPNDTMPPLEALRALTGNTLGRVEELELLEKVWPEWSGSVRYKLTATTLTWQWSAKHTGRYATITVPFPTRLPMSVEVVRFCDMDDLANHSDDCPRHPSEDDDGSEGDDCHCESWVEQTVTATVTDWNNSVEAQLRAWLDNAVITRVEPVTIPDLT